MSCPQSWLSSYVYDGDGATWRGGSHQSPWYLLCYIRNVVQGRLDVASLVSALWAPQLRQKILWPGVFVRYFVRSYFCSSFAPPPPPIILSSFPFCARRPVATVSAGLTITFTTCSGRPDAVRRVIFMNQISLRIRENSAETERVSAEACPDSAGLSLALCALQIYLLTYLLVFFTAREQKRTGTFSIRSELNIFSHVLSRFTPGHFRGQFLYTLMKLAACSGFKAWLF